MSIIIVANTKGGAGKTMTSTNIAVGMSRMGLSVLLVDCDDPAVSAGWGIMRNEQDVDTQVTVVALRNKAVKTETRKLAQNYDHVIVDVGGSDNPSLRYALMIADIVIIPSPVSFFDSMHFDKLVQVLEDIHPFNEDVTVRMFANKVNPLVRNSGELAEFLSANGYDFELLDTFVDERQVYVTASAQGLSVLEYGKNEKAVAQISSLLDEVMSLVDEKEAEHE